MIFNLTSTSIVYRSPSLKLDKTWVHTFSLIGSHPSFDLVNRFNNTELRSGIINRTVQSQTITANIVGKRYEIPSTT